VKLPHIFSNKFTSIIAGVVALGYFYPIVKTDLDLITITAFFAWTLGAIYTWKKQIWATILLASLAVYNLIFDVILEIPNLPARMEEMSAKYEFSKSTLQTLTVLAMSFEALIMICIIYYGITTLGGSEERQKGN
jgi:ABC-type polysaccharide/polyol phosphate export permease